jgi:trimeric autotransporter adhesin
LNNINQPVWIRIVTLTGTSGGGSRPSTAIDDVKFSWN